MFLLMGLAPLSYTSDSMARGRSNFPALTNRLACKLRTEMDAARLTIHVGDLIMQKQLIHFTIKTLHRKPHEAMHTSFPRLQVAHLQV
jgi:hypothetical protein